MMAENESLDLADSRRWQSVYHCVRQEKSSQEVGSRVARCLCSGLRVAIKQFAKKGVTIKDLLAARHDPIALHRLVKKTQGHDYALLFEETALADKAAADEVTLERFVRAVWDKMSDQIAQNVVPCEKWQNFPDLRGHLHDVGEEIALEVHRIGGKLAEDPTWIPRRSATKGGIKENQTQILLGESMLRVLPK